MTQQIADEDRLPSLVQLLAFVSRHWRLFFFAAAGVAILAGLLTAVLPRIYTVRAKFIPESRNRSGSALSGVAAQFGFAVPDGDPTQSPAFYVELLSSPTVLGRVADNSYKSESGVKPLAESLRVRETSPALRRDKTIDVLREMITVGKTRETNVVTVAVRSRDPLLAEQLASALITTVSAFNTESRQGRAAAERRFVEQRETQAKVELRTTEDRLQGFLQRNMAIGRSSATRFEQDRLEREVTLRQQVYSTLAQAVEQARIEAVRDTPVITLIEVPVVPSRPDPRRWITHILFGIIFGGALAGFLAILLEVRASNSLTPLMSAK